ncbi:MAG: NAD(P)/FAD-dependent oxidoreductase, partial [Nitrospiraceae bacterium]
MPEQGAVKSYDLIVIGTGDAGKTVATAAAREGWRVAIIEKKEVGGTCALWGCVPKKILLTGAEIVHFSRRMAAAGINTGPSVLSWQELMTYKNRLTASYSADDAGQLRALGIDLYRGEARFIGSATVQTAGDTLRGRYVHIASGARPRPLEIPGEEHMITSAEFLYLDSLPPRVIFIGGGFISFEFAHLAARCGSEAVILTRGGRVLKRFDPDLAALLLESSERDGITVALNQQILRIEKTDAGFSVFAESGGRDQEYRADLVVHGAGRVPDIDGLDPEAGGIKASPEGI